MHCGTNSFVISFFVTAHLYYRYLTQIPIFFNILTDTEEGLKTFIRGRVSEPELSLWPGSTLNICLIIHANYCIWYLTSFDIFSKVNIKQDLSVGTCVRTYIRQFVVSYKKFQNNVLFYQKPEPAPGRKFTEPEPPQNRPAPKP